MRTKILARSSFAVTVAFSAGAIWFRLTGGHEPPIDIAVAVTFSSVGVLIASRHPKNAIGWLFCAAGVLAGLQSVANQYAAAALRNAVGNPQIGLLAAWFTQWAWIPWAMLLPTLLVILFPDGKPRSRNWARLIWLASVATTLAIVSLALTPGPFVDYGNVRNSFGIDSAPYLEYLGLLGVFPIGLSFTIGSVGLIRRYRRAAGKERSQIRLMGFGGLVVAAAFTLSFSLLLFFPRLSGAGPLIVTLALLAIPIATGIAILRHGLSRSTSSSTKRSYMERSPRLSRRHIWGWSLGWGRSSGAGPSSRSLPLQ